MTIQLIAMDVDGTLADSKKRVGARTVRVIEEAAQRGIQLAVCTGRSTREIREIAERLPWVLYGITANGAYLVDLRKQKIIDKQLLSIEDIRSIYGCLKGFDMMFELYTEDKVLAPAQCLKDLDHYGVGNLKELVKSSRTGIEDFDNLLYTRTEGAGKINIFFTSPKQRDQAAERARVLPYYMTHQEATNLEFTKKGTTKGRGLQHLAKMLQIESQNVMAIGDNNNDIPMLEYAGLPVAMGNGLDSLKEIAAFVTKTNDEDGVGYAIEQLAL